MSNIFELHKKLRESLQTLKENQILHLYRDERIVASIKGNECKVYEIESEVCGENYILIYDKNFRIVIDDFEVE